MANRKHVPTDEQRTKAKGYAAVGLPHHDIAKMVGVSIKTLLKHYRDELDLGKATANAQVAGKLFSMAIGGNVASAIFWLKAQAGWRETQRHELGGLDGEPIKSAQIIAEATDGDAMRAYVSMLNPTKE